MWDTLINPGLSLNPHPPLRSSLSRPSSVHLQGGCPRGPLHGRQRHQPPLHRREQDLVLMPPKSSLLLPLHPQSRRRCTGFHQPSDGFMIRTGSRLANQVLILLHEEYLNYNRKLWSMPSHLKERMAASKNGWMRKIGDSLQVRG